MGLGARRNQGDECTGLDALQELLGRLNGRSEEDLGAERKKREGVRVSRYLERKLGTVRFVYGGLLVGDKVQALADELKKEKEEKAAAGEGQEDRKSKKRKAEDEGESVSKKEKKSKKRRSEDEDAESKAKRKEKKDKKRKEKEASIQGGSESRTAEVPKPGEDDEDSSTQKKSKKDKREKRKKDKNQEDAAAGDLSDSQSKKKKKRRADKDDEADSSKPTPSTTQTPTPAASGTSTPVSEVPHRHLARRRFIAQKRAAVMDPAALNQVRLPYARRLSLSRLANMIADLHGQGMSEGVHERGSHDRCLSVQITLHFITPYLGFFKRHLALLARGIGLCLTGHTVSAPGHQRRDETSTTSGPAAPLSISQ